MSGSGKPKLQKNDSSLSMRTRKSNQDFRVLAAESLSRKGGVDEEVFASDNGYQENDGLLSQVIEMGTDDNDDDWYHKGNNSRLKESQKWYNRSILSVVNNI